MACAGAWYADGVIVSQLSLRATAKPAVAACCAAAKSMRQLLYRISPGAISKPVEYRALTVMLKPLHDDVKTGDKSSYHLRRLKKAASPSQQHVLPASEASEHSNFEHLRFNIVTFSITYKNKGLPVMSSFTASFSPETHWLFDLFRVIRRYVAMPTREQAGQPSHVQKYAVIINEK